MEVIVLGVELLGFLYSLKEVVGFLKALLPHR
jgi:hypothetical protein